MDYIIWIVLRWQVAKKPYVIYYPSHNLNDAHVNCSVIKSEYLATIFAFEMCRSYFVGYISLFSLIMLPISIFSKKDDKPRIVKTIHLWDFDIKIRDMNGFENAIYDHLSQIVFAKELELPSYKCFLDE